MKNLVISFLLGTSTIGEIGANKMSINTFSKADSMAMLLNSSELNLKEYSKDEEESDDDKESAKDETHIELSAEDVELAKNHGRNHNGMFKNHKNFVKMRNKINDQEQKHQKMFDTITKKLSDESFIAQATAATATHGEENAIIGWTFYENEALSGWNTRRLYNLTPDECKEKCAEETSFTCMSIDYTKKGKICDLSIKKFGDPGVVRYKSPLYDHYEPKRDERLANAKLSTRALSGMTDADIACYTARYSDVGSMDARTHFEQIGHAQGRLATCAPNLSEIEEQTYLDRYPDLQHAFGRWGALAKHKANDHMLDFGHKEKRTATPDYGIPLFCADKETTTCKCPGTVWLGLKRRLDNGKRISTWEEFRTWKTVPKTSPTEFLQCSKREFGINKPEYADIETQCWCERYPAIIPNPCAGEGEECLCNGRILFGQKYAKGHTSGKEVNSIISVTTNSWAVNSANKTEQHTCSPAIFEDVDPLPGVAKRCFCDQKMTKISSALEQRVKEYWRQKRREKELREEKVRAEALAEEASKKAAEAKAADEARAIKEKADREAKAKQDKLDAEEAAKKAETKHKADLLAAANAKIKTLEEAKKQAEEAEKQHKLQEAAHKEEDEARAKAEAEGDAAAKAALLKAAEAAKQKAVKAAVDAAIAEANSKAKQEEAQRAEEEEKNRLIQEKAAAELLAAQRAAADAAAEEAAKKHKAEMDARINAEAQARAALLKRHHAELEKQIANALEKQKEAYEAKQKEEAEERAKEKAAADKQAAEALAQQQKEQEAAEAEKKRTEEEEKAAALAEIAEAKKLADRKIEAEKEKLALEKKKYEQAIAAKKAKEDLLQAQRDEELAKTNEEVQAAQAKQAAAVKAAEDAEKAREKAIQDKKDLEGEIDAQEAKANEAKAAAAKAKKATAVAKENAANWKKVAEEAKTKAAKEMAEAEEAATKQKEALEAEQAENKAKHDAALAAQAAAYKAAEEQAKEAQKAAAAARQALIAKNIAKHKSDMAKRKSEFDAKFRNVWATGPTGVSYFQFSINNKEDAEALVAKLFRKTLIADVEIITEGENRQYIESGKVVDAGQTFKVIGVTSDDRVAEMIEEVSAENPNKASIPNFNLVVYTLATGSVEYLKWVKEQTLPHDPELAFFNQKPKDGSAGVSNSASAEEASQKPVEADSKTEAPQNVLDLQQKQNKSKQSNEDEDSDDEDEE